jgi:sulfur carrier protein
MKLIVNGSPYETTDGISVRELLKLRQVKLPDMVSVELNEAIVDRAAFDTTVLAEGDRVELLYFMGGGRGSL